MPSGQVIRVSPASSSPDDSVAAATLRDGIERLQDELGVTPDFPPEVESEAAAVADAVPPLPEEDQTALPFVTIDPAGSMDLDQALHLERAADGSGGYVVHYAIADVHAFVAPEGAIDAESHRRGESLYGADSTIPLHPTALSEGAASLLPDQVRPALLWTSTLDASGEITATTVRRARVRSIARLDYEGVQAMFDGDSFDPAYADSLRLLEEIGELRQALEAERGGITLPLPDQEIDVEGDRWSLTYRTLLPVEGWNAQLSLLTGFGAAAIMLEHRVGLLRTLPPPDPRDVARLRRTATALGIAWPDDLTPADFIRGLDPAEPTQAAMVVASTRLLRGAAYAAFDGELPALTEHAGLASPYAHVTAPLRRLVDRYAGEICVALCAGEAVPAWVRARLDELPATMRESGHRASAYERGILDLAEAGILGSRVGESFEGVVVEAGEKDPSQGTLTIQDPAIEAPVTSSRPLPVGQRVTATLAAADVATRKVAFRLS
ncbi:MAG: RNB domain-containing ribonuclease [Nocardioides sp.]|uniref:RNB domain-containing ribonuclease n=1 Tax=Nocardioides sp. TaxID=35761 RepID=UPI0039E549EA